MTKSGDIKKYLHFFLLIFLFIFHASYAISTIKIIPQISARFLTVPYQFDPLGEGPNGQISQEPLYRFDRFDCETYVDTVLALAHSDNNFALFQHNISELRYQNGTPNFTQRNHFAEADWLPNNIKKGYVEDITQEISTPFQTNKISEIINRRQWYQNINANRIKIPNLTFEQIQEKLNLLHQYSQSVTNSNITVNYIPISNVPKIMQKIPSGAIIFIVHQLAQDKKNILGTSILISHMGFAIWENNNLYLRAASSMKGYVTDLPLLFYLQNIEPSGVLGIKVLLPK